MQQQQKWEHLFFRRHGGCTLQAAAVMVNSQDQGLYGQGLCPWWSLGLGGWISSEIQELGGWEPVSLAVITVLYKQKKTYYLNVIFMSAITQNSMPLKTFFKGKGNKYLLIKYNMANTFSMVHCFITVNLTLTWWIRSHYSILQMSTPRATLTLQWGGLCIPRVLLWDIFKWARHFFIWLTNSMDFRFS